MLIVQKFGGTSLGTPKRIQKVADRITERVRQNDQVVVVVSAMGQTTDELQELALKVTDRPNRREMDMLLTAGERISMALLSMALHARDVPAISFTGSQSGIITDTAHTRARITAVKPIRIGPELNQGKVVIVAGFQGVSPLKEVTTLGRGGSDTTAIALAHGLGADLCEIYSDVPGVMTADPRNVDNATLLDQLPWDTMLEMATTGAGVMHSRAVELARRTEVRFHVRSTFRKGEGTLVEGKIYEDVADVAAVTGRSEIAEIHLQNLNLGSALVDAFYAQLDDMLEDVTGLHQFHTSGGTNITFNIPIRPEEEDIEARLRRLADEHGGSMSVRKTHAAVSLVGSGTLDPTAVAAKAHAVLRDASIEAASLITNPMSLTFLVPKDDYGRAQQAFHKAFIEEKVS